MFTPLHNRIRYEVIGSLFCLQMNKKIRNRATYTYNDAVWLWVFGSKRAVDKFLTEGKVIKKVIKLSKLGYEPCDFALGEPAFLKKKLFQKVSDNAF